MSELIFNFSDYSQYEDYGCVAVSSNSWSNSTSNKQYQIPLDDFIGYDTITITANNELPTYFAFFSEKQVKEGGNIAYADGWTAVRVIPIGTTETFTIPANAKIVYFGSTSATGKSLLPSSVVFSKEVQKPIITETSGDGYALYNGSKIPISDVPSGADYISLDGYTVIEWNGATTGLDKMAHPELLGLTGDYYKVSDTFINHKQALHSAYCIYSSATDLTSQWITSDVAETGSGVVKIGGGYIVSFPPSSGDNGATYFFSGDDGSGEFTYCVTLFAFKPVEEPDLYKLMLTIGYEVGRFTERNIKH